LTLVIFESAQLLSIQQRDFSKLKIINEKNVKYMFHELFVKFVQIIHLKIEEDFFFKTFIGGT